MALVLEEGARLSESKTEGEKQLAGARPLISPLSALPEPAEGEPRPPTSSTSLLFALALQGEWSCLHGLAPV